MSQKRNQTTEQNPVGIMPSLSGSAGRSLVVNESETGYTHQLITGSSGGGSGDGDANAAYIVNEATASLPNALPILAGPNITLGSGSGGLEITGSAGAGSGDGDSQATYIVNEATGSLPNALPVVAGDNIIINSGSGFLEISGSKTSIPLVVGNQSSNQTGFSVIGSTELDISEYDYTTIMFKTIFETSDASDATEVRLWNATNETLVSSSVMTTTSTLAFVTSSIVTPDIMTGSNIYEVQLRLQTTGSPNAATCKKAELILE
jgi:hypothetical protein